MANARELRLRAVEDELALRRLVNNYMSIADKQDWKGWSELFTESGIFLVSGTGQALNGQREIYEVTRERLAGAFQDTQHYITNLDVEINGDTATAMGDLIFAAVADRNKPEKHLLIGGRYKWSFTRVRDKWQVARAGCEFVWNNRPGESVSQQAEAAD
jgi:uncharacterized protein (TIGR02246 family)